MKRWQFLIAIVILAVSIGLVWQEARKRWEEPLVIEAESLRLMVAPGDRLRSVVDELQAEGVMPYPYLLLAYARWTGLDERIKRGEYDIPAGTTAVELLTVLTEGDVVQHQVTLPEGITLVQAIAILQSEPKLQHVIKGIDDDRILRLVGPDLPPEGLFFPDSYNYEKGTSDWLILQRAHSRMAAVLDQEWGDRADSLPYETPYEALIMASIVERETGVPTERKQIAGVFVRRLLKNMRLQTDPTVIYGLGEDFDGNLRRRHLQDDTNPYNTYRHKGLPPSPIALPGQAAINAALHPAAGETLYFVAKGDGSHQFSRTLEEHNNAVKQFQLNRTENYRSRPENN